MIHNGLALAIQGVPVLIFDRKSPVREVLWADLRLRNGAYRPELPEQLSSKFLQ